MHGCGASVPSVPATQARLPGNWADTQRVTSGSSCGKTRFPFEGVQAERWFAGCDLHRLVVAETVAMEQDGGWWGLQVRCYDAPSTIKALIDVLCRSRSETFLTSNKEQEGAANVTLKSDTDVWGPLTRLSGGSRGSKDADHRHQHKPLEG